jgi:hypothetical protein
MTVTPLPLTPPDFAPGERLTEERMKALGVLENEFLTEEERKLVSRSYSESHQPCQ